MKAKQAISSYRKAVGELAGLPRLDKVRTVSHNSGYGVGDDMDSLVAKYVGE